MTNWLRLASRVGVFEDFSIQMNHAWFLRIHKSLNQQHQNSELIEPIIVEPLANQFEYLGSEVGPILASGRKDRET